MPVDLDLDALERWARALVPDGGNYAGHASRVIDQIPALIARVRDLEATLDVLNVKPGARCPRCHRSDRSPDIGCALCNVPRLTARLTEMLAERDAAIARAAAEANDGPPSIAKLIDASSLGRSEERALLRALVDLSEAMDLVLYEGGHALGKTSRNAADQALDAAYKAIDLAADVSPPRRPSRG